VSCSTTNNNTNNSNSNSNNNNHRWNTQTTTTTTTIWGIRKEMARLSSVSSLDDGTNTNPLTNLMSLEASNAKQLVRSCNCIRSSAVSSVFCYFSQVSINSPFPVSSSVVCPSSLPLLSFHEMRVRLHFTSLHFTSLHYTQFWYIALTTRTNSNQFSLTLFLFCFSTSPSILSTYFHANE